MQLNSGPGVVLDREDTATLAKVFLYGPSTAEDIALAMRPSLPARTLLMSS
jgi:hypothetical protein